MELLSLQLAHTYTHRLEDTTKAAYAFFDKRIEIKFI